MMKKHYFAILAIAIAAAAALYAFSGDNGYKYPSGAPAGYTGSPGDGQSCTACHGGTASTISGILTSDVPPTGYIAGNTYTFTVTLTGSGKKGFEASPQSPAGALLGTLIAGSGNHLTGSGKYVTQSQSNSASTATWNFQWVAPAPGTGTVTMYIARAQNISNARVSTLVLNENYGVGNDEKPAINCAIYPNPSSGIIFTDFSLPKPETIKIHAYKLNGQLAANLYEGFLDAGEHHLELPDVLKPGAYLLTLRSENLQISKKFVVL